MFSAWTKHLKTEEEKERFRSSVQGSRVVLDRLKDIYKEIEDDQDRIERNPKIYDTPGWDYRMAHLNGFRDCLHKVSLIVDLDQQDKNEPPRPAGSDTNERPRRSTQQVERQTP